MAYNIFAVWVYCRILRFGNANCLFLDPALSSPCAAIRILKNVAFLVECGEEMIVIRSTVSRRVGGDPARMNDVHSLNDNEVAHKTVSDFDRQVVLYILMDCVFQFSIF